LRVVWTFSTYAHQAYGSLGPRLDTAYHLFDVSRGVVGAVSDGQYLVSFQRPASPARAASIAAFKASRLVYSETLRITSTTLLISYT
jgi:hypothetical protein